MVLQQLFSGFEILIIPWGPVSRRRFLHLWCLKKRTFSQKVFLHREVGGLKGNQTLHFYERLPIAVKSQNISHSVNSTLLTNHSDLKMVFLTFSTPVIKTEQPISTKIISPVTLCSLIPRNLGCSPGAEHSDSSLRLFTWVIDSTVAATNHGSPMIEQIPSISPTISRSRW